MNLRLKIFMPRQATRPTGSEKFTHSLYEVLTPLQIKIKRQILHALEMTFGAFGAA